jgi:hypothetical protein
MIRDRSTVATCAASRPLHRHRPTRHTTSPVRKKSRGRFLKKRTSEMRRLSFLHLQNAGRKPLHPEPVEGRTWSMQSSSLHQVFTGPSSAAIHRRDMGSELASARTFRTRHLVARNYSGRIRSVVMASPSLRRLERPLRLRLQFADEAFLAQRAPDTLGAAQVILLPCLFTPAEIFNCFPGVNSFDQTHGIDRLLART